MTTDATLRLVGGLRVGRQTDESFYDDLLARLPKEVAHTGEMTRFVAFDHLAEGEDALTFLGIEVDAIDEVPEGLMGWTLDGHELTVLAAGSGEPAVIWREAVHWEWRAVAGAFGNRPVTGEFRVPVPGEWTAEGRAAERDFILSANIYTAPGRRGADDAIALVDYDPAWPGRFEAFSQEMRQLLGPEIALRIEHHGSTAIPGMRAKPIIDMLVVVPAFAPARRRVLPLLNRPEWEYVWYHRHMALIRRNGFLGQRICHVHMMPEGPMLERYLAFRDHLRAHPADAAVYAALKGELARKYTRQRERYTAGKADFVNAIVERALAGA